MNNKQLKYYILFAIIFFLMIILFLLYFLRNCEDAGNIAIGLATGLISAFLVNYKNRIDIEYTEQIKSYDELINTIEKAHKAINNLEEKDRYIDLFMIRAVYWRLGDVFNSVSNEKIIKEKIIVNQYIKELSEKDKELIDLTQKNNDIYISKEEFKNKYQKYIRSYIRVLFDLKSLVLEERQKIKNENDRLKKSLI